MFGARVRSPDFLTIKIKTMKDIEIKQRKVCGNCRALYLGHRGDISRCDLGYEIKEETVFESFIKNPKPTEPCPKPITALDYHTCYKLYKK